jgi:hypothetical protein
VAGQPDYIATALDRYARSREDVLGAARLSTCDLTIAFAQLSEALGGRQRAREWAIEFARTAVEQCEQ